MGSLTRWDLVGFEGRRERAPIRSNLVARSAWGGRDLQSSSGSPRGVYSRQAAGVSLIARFRLAGVTHSPAQSGLPRVTSRFRVESKLTQIQPKKIACMRGDLLRNARENLVLNCSDHSLSRVRE